MVSTSFINFHLGFGTSRVAVVSAVLGVLESLLILTILGFALSSNHYNALVKEFGIFLILLGSPGFITGLFAMVIIHRSKGMLHGKKLAFVGIAAGVFALAVFGTAIL